jgi:hypothetical protein
MSGGCSTIRVRGTTVDDDDNVIEMVRPGHTAGSEGHGGKTGREPFEGEDALPQPGDEYLACGRISNKPETMLCFILRDQRYELFAYSGLVRARMAAPAGPGAARNLQLRFLGAGVTDVTLEGRRLLELVHNLRRHHIPWLRETPTDRPFLDRKAVVITRVTIALGEGHW